MGKWRDDTKKLVERKNFYTFTYNAWTSGGSILSGNGEQHKVLSVDPYKTNFATRWIDDPVAPTTLNYDGQHTFSGHTDISKYKNHHPSNFFATLSINGRIINKYIPLDQYGNWEYEYNRPLNDGDVIEAQINRLENEENANVKRDEAYSSWTEYTIGGDENNISFDKWRVNAPIINASFEQQNYITSFAPKQNAQNDRTYEIEVFVNGKV